MSQSPASQSSDSRLHTRQVRRANAYFLLTSVMTFGISIDVKSINVKSINIQDLIKNKLLLRPIIIVSPYTKIVNGKFLYRKVYSCLQ